ncbi:MAG: 3-deoxy-8-phosphooctulonate synthase [Candidatus Aminicenantes bacterium]|nr:3-deoxy-8-phosphooctulonate synthase [Candidatus Aminicenantes bacterium]
MPTVSKAIDLEGGVVLGGGPLFLIGGPCVIENRKHALFLAREIKAVCGELGVPCVFKASFDKANRSSIASFRGPGLEAGLEILAEVRTEAVVPVLSDIHEAGQAAPAAAVLDIIQIPAFLCRQTDLILAAARTGRPLNIKKGQFMSPLEMKNALDKAADAGNDRVMLTERGTFFGYNNLVVDIRSIPAMKAWGGPVVIDASHSVQRPGGVGTASGGDAEVIPLMAKAGVAAGADGVFIEIHDDPERALSDKHNSLKLKELKGLLRTLLRLRAALDEEAGG